jgi:hypothetical protein
VDDTDRCQLQSCGAVDRSVPCVTSVHGELMCRDARRVTEYYQLGSEEFIAVAMKTTVVWDVAPCSLVEVERSSVRRHCFHLHGRKSRQQATKQQVEQSYWGDTESREQMEHAAESWCNSYMYNWLTKMANNAIKYITAGHVVAYLVEALCYKPEGRGFESRWINWIFQLT